MKDCYRILALIPARGGSKGIKNKNIVTFDNQPLICHTISHAISCQYFDDIVVSTDSVDIMNISQKSGAWVPFLRPYQLAKDDSKIIDVVVHAVEYLKSCGKEYDVVVVLQPTSPLRTSAMIIEAINQFFELNCKSLVSVNKASENPIFMRAMDSNKHLMRILPCQSTVRRQCLPEYYYVNGAIYINWVADLNHELSLNDNEYGYVMDRKNSIDINDITDIYKYEITKNFNKKF